LSTQWLLLQPLTRRGTRNNVYATFCGESFRSGY
jgi:hypothetical protein